MVERKEIWRKRKITLASKFEGDSNIYNITPHGKTLDLHHCYTLAEMDVFAGKQLLLPCDCCLTMSNINVCILLLSQFSRRKYHTGLESLGGTIRSFFARQHVCAHYQII